MLKICILSQQHFSNKHVSEDTVLAFEKAIVQEKSVEVKKIEISEFTYKINRKVNKAGFLIDYKAVRQVKKYNPDYVFIMAMSPGILKFELEILKRISKPKIVYCIDTWSSRVQEWRHVLTNAKVEYVLCSNKKAVDVFSDFCRKAGYLPYSMNGDIFYPRDCMKKHLFMQMGRKNQTLHDYVLRYIADHNLKDSDYIREKERGQIVCPDFNQLAEEINRTMFFVLAPRDIDESDITGEISDVTARFYEGFACKTMLLGYKPKDTFDLLFPNKNSMIEVETYEDFCDKVDYFLKHQDQYKAIVDANYEYLVKLHTWQHRAKELVKFIENL